MIKNLQFLLVIISFIVLVGCEKGQEGEMRTYSSGRREIYHNGQWVFYDISDDPQADIDWDREAVVIKIIACPKCGHQWGDSSIRTGHNVPRRDKGAKSSTK